MAIMVYYFLLALGADALLRDIRVDELCELVCGVDNVVLHVMHHVYIFTRTETGYAVSYDYGAPVNYKRSWQQIQQECIHADCRHRQAEEDNYLHDEESEEEYKKATYALRGCKAAWRLIAKTDNYWRKEV